MLQDQLTHVVPRERPLPGEQFLIDDGEAVLIAKAAHPPVEGLRRRVDRRDAAGDRRLHAFQILDEAEVRDLDVLEHQKQVLRLDVQMLKLISVVHQVQRFGGFLHVDEQLIARDARQTLTAALLEAVPQIALGQLHDDDELAVDDVEAFEREDIGMANRGDAAEGFQFLLGALAAVVAAAEVAEDELDGLVQAARRFRLPDLAETAAAYPLDEPVARNRFGMAFDPHRHKYISKSVFP